MIITSSSDENVVSCCCCCYICYPCITWCRMFRRYILNTFWLVRIPNANVRVWTNENSWRKKNKEIFNKIKQNERSDQEMARKMLQRCTSFGRTNMSNNGPNICVCRYENRGTERRSTPVLWNDTRWKLQPHRIPTWPRTIYKIDRCCGHGEWKKKHTQILIIVITRCVAI